MTLHWWMHWFWITSSAVVFIALHLVQPSVGAPTLRSYTLSTDAEILGQLEAHHGSTITEPHHMQTLYSKSLWDSSIVSSRDESNTVSWQSDTISTVSDTAGKEPLDSNGGDVSQYSTSTYLPLVTEKTELSGEVTPFLMYKSRSPDSASTNNRHMFIYPTTIEEHSVSSIPSTDNSEFTDAETGAVHAAEEVVPVTELSYTIYKTESEKVLPVERTTMSIKSVPSSEDSSSVVIPQKDISSSASNSSDISLHLLFQPLNSGSQGVDKPVVNVPRLITRDLKNNSEAYPSASSSVSILASHNLYRESPDLSIPLPLPQLNPPNIRTGKAAKYIPSQPFVVHPLVVLTTLPSQSNPGTFPFPNSDSSDIMHGFVQGYHQGPKSSVNGGSVTFKDISKSEGHEESDVKIWADNTPENPSHRVGESMIKEKSDLEPEGGDSRITWIKKISPNSDTETQQERTVLTAEVEPGDTGRNPLEDKEMGDSPYIPPEISTARNSEHTDSKSAPIPSSDFVLPSDRVTSESDVKPLDPSRNTHSTEIMRVIPPMMNSSKIMNISSRTPDNATRSSHNPPVVSGNASVQVSAEKTDSSTIISATGGTLADTNSSVLAVPSSLSGAKPVANITSPTSDLEENETTVITVVPTIVPISNAGRVAAPAPSGSHHGLDAASITGISLGILVFAALVGAVSFVLYRRRFLNKPQTLNDKCSNPDSSGYIDDSTLRENSEEMYSLDNDSFLNSLEAMTIQNYWTDNVKHTKL